MRRSNDRDRAFAVAALIAMIAAPSYGLADTTSSSLGGTSVAAAHDTGLGTLECPEFQGFDRSEKIERLRDFYGFAPAPKASAKGAQTKTGAKRVSEAEVDELREPMGQAKSLPTASLYDLPKASRDIIESKLRSIGSFCTADPTAKISDVLQEGPSKRR